MMHSVSVAQVTGSNFVGRHAGRRPRRISENVRMLEPHVECDVVRGGGKAGRDLPKCSSEKEQSASGHGQGADTI